MNCFEFFTDNLLYHLVLLNPTFTLEERRLNFDIVHRAATTTNILHLHISGLKVRLQLQFYLLLLHHFHLIHRTELKLCNSRYTSNHSIH